MTADLGAVFKAGDQGGRARRHGWKDGDLVSIDDMSRRGWGQRTRTAWRDILSDNMLRTFPCAYITPDDRVLVERAQREQCAIRLEALANAANDPNLVRRWRGRDVVPPVRLRRRLRWSDFMRRDEVLTRPTIEDINAVSSGSYNVGSGETYTSLKAAQADIAATLTGALTFTMTSATSESTGFSYFEPDLDGNTLTFTSDTDHAGLLSGGNKASCSGTGYLFRFRTTGSSGKLVIKLMNIFADTDGQASQIGLDNVDTGNDVEIHNTIMDLDDTSNYGIDLDLPDVDFLVWLIGIIDGSNGGIKVDGASSGAKIENCTVRNPAGISSPTGIDLNSVALTARNNAAEGSDVDTGEDWFDVDGATGRNNSSGDLTAANGEWSTGTSNLTGQGSGQFDDGTWQITSSSNLCGAGSAPEISGHTAGINGTAYGGIYPIGCWKCEGNGNQHGAVAFGFVF